MASSGTYFAPIPQQLVPNMGVPRQQKTSTNIFHKAVLVALITMILLLTIKKILLNKDSEIKNRSPASSQNVLTFVP